MPFFGSCLFLVSSRGPQVDSSTFPEGSLSCLSFLESLFIDLLFRLRDRDSFLFQMILDDSAQGAEEPIGQSLLLLFLLFCLIIEDSLDVSDDLSGAFRIGESESRPFSLQMDDDLSLIQESVE